MRLLLTVALSLSLAAVSSADVQVLEYPGDVTGCAGAHVQIGARAVGQDPVRYLWQKETAPLVWAQIQEAWYSPGMPPPPTVYIELGTNRSVLSIPVTRANAGRYRVDIIEQRDGEPVEIALLGSPFFITPLAADVGGQGGVPGADGQSDANDFIVYIDAFFGGAVWADMGRQGGQTGGDGLFDSNDLIVFIDQFFNGCNQAP